MSRIVRKRKRQAPPESPLAALMEKHLDALRIQNYSEYTIKGRRVRIRYMTQPKARPPTFVLFGNQLKALPESYLRYLTNGLRAAFAMPDALANAEQTPRGVLRIDASRLQQEYEWSRAAIHDGQFARAHLDKGIVDTKPRECREQVLYA